MEIRPIYRADKHRLPACYSFKACIGQIAEFEKACIGAARVILVASPINGGITVTQAPFLNTRATLTYSLNKLYFSLKNSGNSNGNDHAITLLAVALSLSSGALAQSYAEILSKHWFFGLPLGTAATDDLLTRDSYAMANNGTTKFPDWVAYRLSPEESWGSLGLEQKWNNLQN